MLIDCNYTRLGDGTSPVRRPEAKPSESMAHMSAMGHVENIHTDHVTLESLVWVVVYADGRAHLPSRLLIEQSR